MEVNVGLLGTSTIITAALLVMLLSRGFLSSATYLVLIFRANQILEVGTTDTFDEKLFS